MITQTYSFLHGRFILRYIIIKMNKYRFVFLVFNRPREKVYYARHIKTKENKTNCWLLVVQQTIEKKLELQHRLFIFNVQLFVLRATWYLYQTEHIPGFIYLRFTGSCDNKCAQPAIETCKNIVKIGKFIILAMRTCFDWCRLLIQVYRTCLNKSNIHGLGGIMNAREMLSHYWFTATFCYCKIRQRQL